MGSIFDFCCESQSQKEMKRLKYIQTIDSNLEEAEDQSMLLSTKSRLPVNVMQMKIKTKHLIQKRSDSPFSHYTIIEKLGSGSYGIVYKVEHKSSGAIRALKQIPKMYITECFSSNQIANEIGILRLLDHPNIIKIYEFYEDTENFYIVTEYCGEGDLKCKCEKLGKLSEFNAKFLMHQIFNAIIYLHSNHVIHGDIKLENVLLNSNTNKGKNGGYLRSFSTLDLESKVGDIIKEFKIRQSLPSNSKDKKEKLQKISKTLTKKANQYLKDLSNYEIKLIDFGCSKILNKKKIKAIIGTSVYCSPEVVDNEFNEKCDEWSCGVLLYFLISGSPPFTGETEEEVFKKIKTKEVEFPSPQFDLISNECIDLIKKLLDKNVNTRISAADALKEPFFQNQFDVEDFEFSQKEFTEKLNEFIHNPHGFKSKFSELVYAYIALNYIDKEDEAKIKKIFKAMCKDNSNYQINKEEFIIFCIENLESHDHLTTDQLGEVFERIDADNSGTIEYQELVRALCDREALLNENNLRSAFEFFDVNKTGNITWLDINNIIFGNRKVDDSLMKEYLGQINKSKNAKITFDEFCTIVK